MVTVLGSRSEWWVHMRIRCSGCVWRSRNDRTRVRNQRWGVGKRIDRRAIRGGWRYHRMFDSVMVRGDSNRHSASWHALDWSRKRQRFGFLIEILRAVILAFAPADDSTSTIHAAVPPILHSVIAASSKSTGDFGPALAHLAYQSFDKLAFIWRDRLMVQCGFEILVKAFSTLLRRSGSNHIGDPNPVVGALARDQCQKIIILLLRPWTPFVLRHRGPRRIAQRHRILGEGKR